MGTRRRKWIRAKKGEPVRFERGFKSFPRTGMASFQDIRCPYCGSEFYCYSAGQLRYVDTIFCIRCHHIGVLEGSWFYFAAKFDQFHSHLRFSKNEVEKIKWEVVQRIIPKLRRYRPRLKWEDPKFLVEMSLEEHFFAKVQR